MYQNNTDRDNKFINIALNLSRKNLGLSAPNPVVAAIIVINNTIISTGITAPNGRPHAEKIAINKVNNKEILKSATIYVTLEPCSHFGETSPCVDEIIKYGFKKVVIAIKDPNKKVNGQGIKKLQEANIETIFGIFEEEAKEINRGFFKVQTQDLPFITLKLATSLDEKIAYENGNSKWITNEKSRQYSHYLRSINDAILIGANTARIDNPRLDCRIKGLEEYSPIPIIISQSLNLDPNLEIFKRSPIILTNSDKTLKNCEIIKCQNIKEGLEKLAIRGINSIIVEGGQNVSTQFLKEELVDELIWIKSNKNIGSNGVGAINNNEFESISVATENFKKIEQRNFDSDSMTRFIKI